MIYITYSRNNGNFKVHKSTFPYDSITYIGYTEKEMMKKVRKDFQLEHKHIEWIGLGK